MKRFHDVMRELREYHDDDSERVVKVMRVKKGTPEHKAARAAASIAQALGYDVSSSEHEPIGDASPRGEQSKIKSVSVQKDVGKLAAFRGDHGQMFEGQTGLGRSYVAVVRFVNRKNPNDDMNDAAAIKSYLASKNKRFDPSLVGSLKSVDDRVTVVIYPALQSGDFLDVIPRG